METVQLQELIKMGFVIGFTVSGCASLLGFGVNKMMHFLDLYK